MYLGAWQIDDTLTFYLSAANYSTGAAADADSAPTYRIYEDEAGTPILTGTMALLDGSNTAGFYSEQITLSVANGLEIGKQYSIYIAYTVATVAHAMHHTFQVESPITLGAAGVPVNTTAASATITTGTQSSGTYASTYESNDAYHVITDSGGTLDMYYQFAVGGDGIANTVVWEGHVSGPGDAIGVYLYEWSNTTWQQVGAISGKNQTNDDALQWSVTTAHTGTGANLGLVRVRFYGAGLTSAALNTDRLLVGYAVVNRSIGYADGAVWLDTVNGSAGTESFVNGTADKPSNTLASAIAIMNALNIKRLHCVSGSSIALAATFPYQVSGDNYVLALGGQDISGAVFQKFGPMSGVATGTNPVFDTGPIGNVTLPPCVIVHCGFLGTLTVGSAGDYIIADCHSQVPGMNTPVIDLVNGLGATNINIRRWSGGLTLNNVQAGDVISVDVVSGGTVTINGTGGLVHVRGMVAVADGSNGAVTIVRTQALNLTTIGALGHDMRVGR